MPQRLVVGPPRAAEMGRVAQLADHHPQGRAQTQTDLNGRLGRDHPEEVEPGLQAHDQHHESQHGDRQLIPRHEVVSPRRLEHAGDHHRETEARGRHRLEPEELHDQGVRADLKRRVRQGQVGHAQQGRDLHDRHRRVEVHPARDRPVDPVAIAAGPGVGDLPLQRRARAELEQELEKTEPPGETVRPILDRPDRLQDQPGRPQREDDLKRDPQRQPECPAQEPAQDRRQRPGAGHGGGRRGWPYSRNPSWAGSIHSLPGGESRHHSRIRGDSKGQIASLWRFTIGLRTQDRPSSLGSILCCDDERGLGTDWTGPLPARPAGEPVLRLGETEIDT